MDHTVLTRDTAVQACLTMLKAANKQNEELRKAIIHLEKERKEMKKYVFTVVVTVAIKDIRILKKKKKHILNIKTIPHYTNLYQIRLKDRYPQKRGSKNRNIY